MSGRRLPGPALAVGTLSAGLIGVSCLAVTAAVDRQPPEVSVHTTEPSVAEPRTRQEFVDAWREELAKNGEALPPGWRELPTWEIRHRYHQARLAGRDPQDLDPAMPVRDPCGGAWTEVFRPGCW